MAITSGLLTFFLPETRGKKMPESFDDIEKYESFYDNLILIFVIKGWIQGSLEKIWKCW